MNLDQKQLRQFAPFLLPIVLLGAGWMLLVRPAAAESEQAARQLESLRPRLEAVRAALMEPPPPQVNIQPAQAFERQVAIGDASGQLFAELARLAPRTRYHDVMIATGEAGVVTPGAGPRVSGDAEHDPRLALFAAPLGYLPVTMSFEADYASVGDFLWQLRDLGTLIEIRTIELRRSVARAGQLRVALTLHAYTRAEAASDVARASRVSAGTTADGAPGVAP